MHAREQEDAPASFTLHEAPAEAPLISIQHYAPAVPLALPILAHERLIPVLFCPHLHSIRGLHTPLSIFQPQLFLELAAWSMWRPRHGLRTADDIAFKSQSLKHGVISFLDRGCLRSIVSKSLDWSRWLPIFDDPAMSCVDRSLSSQQRFI